MGEDLDRRINEATQAWMRAQDVRLALPAVRAAVDTVSESARDLLGCADLGALENQEDRMVDAIAALRDAVENL